MSTAADIIRGALLDLGAIAQIETPSASETSDGLASLNEMLDSWSADGFLIYEEENESFALTPGQQQHTIGSGGDFNTTRPIRIKRAGIKQSASESEIRMEIKTQQEWARIPLKSTQSTIPRCLWYNPAFPLGEVNFYPVPSAAAVVVLYSEKPLAQFALSTTVVSLPPGYYRALRKNLALEIAPQYGKMPSPLVIKQAQEAMDFLKRRNSEPVLMVSDAVGLTNKTSKYDYRIGE